MKMRKFVAVAAMATMALAGIANAQDMGVCVGGMAQADCDVIAAATSNTLATATSFQQDWTIDFSASGIPDSEPITFNATGTGPVILDLTTPTASAVEQTLTVQAGGAGAPIDTTVGFILKDGAIYVKSGDAGWQVITADQVEAQLGSATSGLGIDPTTMTDTSNPAMTDAMGMMSSLTALTEIPGFLTYTRDGGTFTFVADVSKLINDPSFSTTLQSITATLPEDQQAQLGMVGILPMLLSSGTITVVQTVDEAANIVTGLDFNVDATINAAMLSSDATEPVVITLKFSVDLSQVNSTFDIVAPADATPVDMGS